MSSIHYGVSLRDENNSRVLIGRPQKPWLALNVMVTCRAWTTGATVPHGFARQAMHGQREVPSTAMFLLYGKRTNMMGVIRVAEKSAIERIRELDAERASLFEQAKEEALKKATDAITDLIALGLDYQLIKGVAKPAKSNQEKSWEP